jgi:hypothetical protein
MTDAATAALKADGWATIDDDGFINLIGPLWRRMNGANPEYAIVGQTSIATAAASSRAAY